MYCAEVNQVKAVNIGYLITKFALNFKMGLENYQL